MGLGDMSSEKALRFLDEEDSSGTSVESILMLSKVCMRGLFIEDFAHTPAEVIRPRPDWEDRKGITTSGLTKEAEARMWRNVKIISSCHYDLATVCGSERIILVAFLKTTMPFLLWARTVMPLQLISTPSNMFSRGEDVSVWAALRHRLPAIGSCVPLSNCLQLIFEISITSVRCAKPTNTHCGLSASSSLSWL